MEICGDEPVLRYLENSELSSQSRNSKQFLQVPTLNDLIRELYRVFEQDKINVDYVKELMNTYKSNPREWKQFAKFDRHRYTRNLVDEGNGKFNLMILAWAEGQGSSIHDHANSHCFMKLKDYSGHAAPRPSCFPRNPKLLSPREPDPGLGVHNNLKGISGSVLSGGLKELKFAWPEQPQEGSTNGQEIIQEMTPIDETSLKTNEVTYINDSIGLHRVENESHVEVAVSLHLYCPPFESVALFDQRTGHKTMGKVTFWSKYGLRTPFGVRKQLEEADYENN